MQRFHDFRVRMLFLPAVFFIFFTSGCTKEEKTIVQASTGDAAWHEVGTPGEPAFQSGWSNYSAATASCAFRKDGQNVVHLKGIVTGNAAGSTTPIFNLPAGYRSTKRLEYLVLSANTSQSSVVQIVPLNDTLCQVQNTSTYFGYLSLDGITFFAEN